MAWGQAREIHAGGASLLPLPPLNWWGTLTLWTTLPWPLDQILAVLSLLLLASRYSECLGEDK